MNVPKADSIIVIPAHNEEKSLPYVIQGILNSKYIDRIIDIVVVNNGSTDQTKEVAIAQGVMVVDEMQKGYGQACLSGIEKAYELNPKYILFIDADFSDNPDDLGLVIRELDRGSDLTIGSRMLGKAEKGALLPQAKFGNKLATFLMARLFGGKRFTDLGPLRGIRVDTLKEIQMQDQNFGWTIEMQIKAILYGVNITEVSVSYKKRIGVSKITGTFVGTISAGYKILWTIFYYYFKTLRMKRPN